MTNGSYRQSVHVAQHRVCVCPFSSSVGGSSKPEAHMPTPATDRLAVAVGVDRLLLWAAALSLRRLYYYGLLITLVSP